MILQATSNNGGEFEKAPEGMGRAVVVDVTPPVESESTYNGKTTKRMTFKIVFELAPEDFGTRANGEPYNVWSRTFTCSLNERSALRPFIENVLGRPLSATELVGFDTETLLGLPVKIVVVHNPSKDGSTSYANIASVRAYAPKPGEKPAYVASGKFVRKQDRPEKDAPSGASASYRKADKPVERDDWMTCKIHVGRFKGTNLGDLDEEPFMKLYNNWRPKIISAQEAGERILADDTRLLAALEAGKKKLDEMKNLAATSADSDVDEPY